MENILSRPYPHQMRNLFLRLGDEFAEARGIPGDADALLRRQRLTRARLAEALGLPLFEKADLAARVTGVIERDGYRIEKVIYQSQPDFWVTAALYLPTHAPLPAPAVLNPHGHWERGRYHPEVQRRMIGLAKRGYVALSLDKVGYNEREPQGPHRSRNLFLVGGTVQGVQAWDNMRGIDYLCSRPEVDPTRIGCTGASGGGNQTMYVTALDDRITASAPVCSVEMGECYLHKAFCTCETVPGLFTFADLVDIAALAAPRPLLLIHGILDQGFRLDSAQKADRRLRHQYRLLGAEERLAHFLSYDGHAYNRAMREAVYAWFDCWLMAKELPYAPEGEVTPEAHPATSLRVLPEALPGKGMLEIYAEKGRGNEGTREREGSLPRFGAEGGTAERSEVVIGGVEGARERGARVAHSLTPSLPHSPLHVSPLDRVLAGPFEAGDGMVPGGWPARGPLRPQIVETGEAEVGEAVAYHERLYIFSEPDVVLPLVYFQARGTSPGEVTLHLSLDGKQAVPLEAVATDLAAGRGALLLDVRGAGETRQETRNPDLWLSSVVLGRPIHGMRAWDLRRACDWLLQRGHVTSVTLRAHGSAAAGLVALLAAALDRRFASLSVDELLVSFRDQPDFGANGDWVIPRILEAGDIDDLLALIAPRPVTVARFVRADGTPVSDPKVWTA